MSNSRVTEWAYKFACICAAAAVVYRMLWFFDIGHRLYTKVSILPYNFLEFSLLLFVISIAGNARKLTAQKDKEEVKSDSRKAA